MNEAYISFLNSFNSELKVMSPGRINFIGEHTDYNNGYVLPTATDKRIIVSFRKSQSDSKCTILSKTYSKMFTFDLSEVSIRNEGWENYIVGVVSEIQKLTQDLKAFDCVIESNLPLGSGVSSSAALECGIAYGLNELFNLGLSTLQMISLSQRAEHNFVGTKCGIMDQFAVMMSKKDKVLLLDCSSNEHEYIDANIDPYVILLLNTNVSHNLTSSEYNTRREECESVVKNIHKDHQEVKSLRDVSSAMLQTYKNQISELLYQRAAYVIEENKRVLEAVESLKSRDIIRLGKLMYQSHKGLQHQYDVSCPELDFLVDFSEPHKQILGSRMMGGGFGGCTINLIHKDAVDNYVELVSKAYKKQFGIDLTPFITTPSQGTSMYL